MKSIAIWYMCFINFIVLSYNGAAQDCNGGIIIIGPSTICSGETAMLEVVTSWDSPSYLWNTGDTLPIIVVDDADEYSVTVTNPEGCIDSAIFTISVIIGDLTCDTIMVCEGMNIEGYCWIGADSIEPMLITMPGIYSITVVDIYGCIYTSAIVAECDSVVTNVRYQTKTDLLVYPNPNEGKFTIEGVDNITVYDIYGKIVYRSYNGDIDLSAYPDGIYFISIRIGGAFLAKILVKSRY